MLKKEYAFLLMISLNWYSISWIKPNYKWFY